MSRVLAKYAKLVKAVGITPGQADAPVSASFRNPMICASENRFFTSNLLFRAGLQSLMLLIFGGTWS
jgi:hypothetical protein